MHVSLGLIFDQLGPKDMCAAAATCREWRRIIASRPFPDPDRWRYGYIGRHNDVPTTWLLEKIIAAGGCGSADISRITVHLDLGTSGSRLSNTKDRIVIVGQCAECCATRNHVSREVDDESDDEPGLKPGPEPPMWRRPCSALPLFAVPEMLRRWLDAADDLDWDELARLVYLSLPYPGLARRMIETIIAWAEFPRGAESHNLIEPHVHVNKSREGWFGRHFMKNIAWFIPFELYRLPSHSGDFEDVVLELTLTDALNYINDDNPSWSWVLDVVGLYSGKSQWTKSYGQRNKDRISGIDPDALEVAIIFAAAIMPDENYVEEFVDAMRGPASQRYVRAQLVGEPEWSSDEE